MKSWVSQRASCLHSAVASFAFGSRWHTQMSRLLDSVICVCHLLPEIIAAAPLYGSPGSACAFLQPHTTSWQAASADIGSRLGSRLGNRLSSRIDRHYVACNSRTVCRLVQGCSSCRSLSLESACKSSQSICLALRSESAINAA